MICHSDYCECRVRNHEIIEKFLTSSNDFVEVSTMPSRDPLITAQTAPSQNSTEVFGLSSVALLSVVGVLVLIVLLACFVYRWRRGKQPKVPREFVTELYYAWVFHCGWFGDVESTVIPGATKNVLSLLHCYFVHP